MTGPLLPAVVVATVVLAVSAYRLGCRCRYATLPTDVIAELARHKLGCLGEPPERVHLELALLFGVRAPTLRERDAPQS